MENYLDSFENEVKKEFAGKLVAFKNEGALKMNETNKYKIYIKVYPNSP